ncbi:hypothetical protein Aph01nite_66310 [Acrocarpospora phusangensis]|uniref:Uncharacterized protein n=1 Tax=Acrocarpospora phusangensis TaxID=1070424 RepID=A0A919UNB6_9ACTN|nr:hypothetical protein [Acrocarpospora phusangensis]GIH28321.1 hypothetical protein Aph01nite_66310 [Acrocarpospora phusangensis]
MTEPGLEGAGLAFLRNIQAEGSPEPGAVAGRTSGGEGSVETAMARLDGLAERPVGEHVAVFEEVLGDLESTLGSVDERT